MKDNLIRFTAALARTGQRRLMLIEGDDDWTRSQLSLLKTTLPGDWLWVGPQPESEPHCLPSAVSTLLGREFTHAVFDARKGFDAQALAALAGTLKAGSWLVLLTPGWDRWAQTPDADSSRWSDQPQPIPTPHFVQHVMREIQRDSDTLRWQQHHPFPELMLPDGGDWHPAQGAPAREQKALLETLMRIEPGVAVVTAARGRGKSALAGMMVQRWPGEVLVTAPARAATDVLAHHAGAGFHFMAPDALLAWCADNPRHAFDWLIIDEAAAIPGPLLQRLLRGFPRVLMTTTVQGYEGTGRGFILKFCASVPHLKSFSLNQPVRWAQGDALERIIDALMLFDDDDFSALPDGECRFSTVESRLWHDDPLRAGAIYRLLSGAHYRTSPLDLRRMMDAPGQHIVVAEAGSRPAGALWLVEEGGLATGLSLAVWAGFRRPRGNLVAQSLAAHGGSPHAATLRGLRVSRVAVHPARQRQHIGSALIERARHAAGADIDYLSVSFGLTEELWRFWQRCGFTLVRVGSHREASSGCYTAMALLPLTDVGRDLTQAEHQRLRRDASWLQPWIDEPLPVMPLHQATLNDDDWLELAGFAFAHRSPQASTASLNRLLQESALTLPALHGWFVARTDAVELSAALGLSGRKALLVRMRAETQQAITARDAERTARLAQQVRAMQFF